MNIDEELEEIKCPICKETYDAVTRIPMTLPDCGHSYCLLCIKDSMEQSDLNLEDDDGGKYASNYMCRCLALVSCARN